MQLSNTRVMNKSKMNKWLVPHSPRSSFSIASIMAFAVAICLLISLHIAQIKSMRPPLCTNLSHRSNHGFSHSKKESEKTIVQKVISIIWLNGHRKSNMNDRIDIQIMCDTLISPSLYLYHSYGSVDDSI